MNEWHVCDLGMKYSYGKFAVAADALREAVKLLRLVHADAYGTKICFKELDKTWGSLYYNDKPFLNITQEPQNITRDRRLVPANFNPQAAARNTAG